MAEEKKVYEELLNEVNRLILKKENKYKDLALDYNFFNIAEIYDNEVILCRFLCSILNPKGEHNEKITFIKLFFDNVLKINDYTDGELEKAKVIKEYQCSNYIEGDDGENRIDIVIETDCRFIGIEVKINAGDQENQCKRYSEFASLLNKNNYQIFYLTKNGNYPSAYSLGTREKKENESELEYRENIIEKECNKLKVIPISWNNDIIKWIDLCMTKMAIDQEKCRKSNVIEILRQYKYIINKFCERGSDEMIKEVEDILDNETNFKCYLELYKVTINIQKKYLVSIMQDIENSLKNDKEFKHGLSSNCKINENDIWYVCRGTNKYPTLDYVTGYSYKDAIVFLSVQVSTGDGLYVGIKLDKKDKKLCKELYEKLKCTIGKSSEDWCTWYSVPINNEIPNFTNPNIAFASLLNKNNYEEYILECIKKIKEFDNLIIKNKNIFI